MDIEDTLIFYNWMPVVADWVIDYTDSWYREWGVSSIHENTFLTNENISAIEEGDIVFVKTDFLKNNVFQEQILPNINVPIVLVSGISSYNVDNYQPLLESSKILKWFCTNPPCVHEKIVGVPIGFEEKERPGGNQKLLKSMELNPIKNGKILLPKHTEDTNKDRMQSIEYLKSLDFVDVQDDKLPFNEYLELISRYKYCICLEGAGFDTHRNYECLLVGTVPIMKTSGVKNIYDDYNLPSRFLDSWSQLDAELYNELKNTSFDFSNVEDFLKTKTHMNRIKNYD